MCPFTIVAHRGVTTNAPENTLPAFERAIELGADAVELDVRLTSDQVPVVYHYYYLDNNTSGSGAIFNHTLAELRSLKVVSKKNPLAQAGCISTLAEILEILGGRIDMEIEIKGPEPEAPGIVGSVLLDFKQLWDTIEVTARVPAFLLAIQKICPGLQADLLYPLSASWMKPDVVQFEALNLARLARASSVHLHPSQLSSEIVDNLRRANIEVHAWDVNDSSSLQLCKDTGVRRICTDDLAQALDFRAQLDR